MEENKSSQGMGSFFISVFMFFSTIVTIFLMSYVYGQEEFVIIRNTVIGAMGIGVVLFLMAQSKEKNLYDYDNKEYYFRFLICYLCSLALTVSVPLLPSNGWPFLTVFILLSFFSNTLIGTTCSTVLLLIAVFLSGGGVEIFALYFFSGIASASIFKGLDENYKVGVPICVSLLMFTVSEIANVILFSNSKLTGELFVIPIINIAVSAIILIIILKIFSAVVIFKYRERYMEINDPECSLLVELKEKSRDEYYKAVHTAYLSEKIAKRLQLDACAAKTGGYYHRIGKLTGENNWENVNGIAVEYGFPPEARQVLKEFIDKKEKIIKKETAVVFFAEAIVSSILFLFAKDKDVKLDYNQVIDTVFKKKQEYQNFSECEMTIAELNTMKQMFKEEKLYYDFLR